MIPQKNRARQGCPPYLALTLNPETTLNLKAEIELSDFNKPTRYKQVFDLKKLPTPVDYFTYLEYQFKGNGIWRKTICPFHEDNLWVTQGRFPKPITLSTTVKLWSMGSIRKWLHEQHSEQEVFND